MTSTADADALIVAVRSRNEEHASIIAAVRTVIHETVQPVTEAVKYGGIMFASDVGFAGVFAYSAHVSVEFGHGAAIHDPHGILEGNGKGRRHLKLRNLHDIEAKQLSTFVRLALEAARSA
jgi:hypothetical protein